MNLSPNNKHILLCIKSAFISFENVINLGLFLYWKSQEDSLANIDPFFPNGLCYPYELEEPIFCFRGVSFLFYFEQKFLYAKSRPWSEAAFCGILSGSVLFTYEPAHVIMVLIT